MLIATLRFAAPMRGASWPATEADECTDSRARPWSRRAPRASRCWARERMTALHAGALIATFNRVAPPRCGAFADERCVIVGDDGDRSISSTSVRVLVRRGRSGLGRWWAPRRTFHRDAPARCRAFADDRRTAAGDGGGGARTRNVLARPSGGAASPTARERNAKVVAKWLTGSAAFTKSNPGAPSKLPQIAGLAGSFLRAARYATKCRAGPCRLQMIMLYRLVKQTRARTQLKP